LGLAVGQGLKSVSPYEWNQSPEAEKWSQKFFDKFGKMPTAGQISEYSAVRHYLAAVKAAGTDNRDSVAAKMRKLPVNDAFVKDGVVRKDGRLMHEIMIVQIKSPSESTGPWDLFKTIRKVSAEDAFRPLSQSACPFAK
jgi:branched-chain amino acid transport system substrate-binding protein